MDLLRNSTSFGKYEALRALSFLGSVVRNFTAREQPTNLVCRKRGRGSMNTRAGRTIEIGIALHLNGVHMELNSPCPNCGGAMRPDANTERLLHNRMERLMQLRCDKCGHQENGVDWSQKETAERQRLRGLQ